MVFTKRLRDGVRRGEITCGVRIQIHFRVKVDARYRTEEGEGEIDSITPIGFPEPEDSEQYQIGRDLNPSSASDTLCFQSRSASSYHVEPDSNSMPAPRIHTF